ncbi:hypothetical protein BCR39DRAFT_530100 [Naematelia encephala]|uniref:DNA-directed RNA polymerase III subunit n=1 Tax=Naematelia encephala TaxID=71784 RepID=A0A1Y2B5W0_9TREE|nr:hypothetical protein BCR39DRAFT_530100 [Naematelia encephala]
MSRGGFAGRGRGRPRGGIYATLAGLHADMGPGMLSSMEMDSLMKQPKKHNGMLYPPLESSSLATLPAPDEFEKIILDETAKLHTTLSAEGQPWRLAGERKVVGIEIESFSDRFALPPQAPTQAQTHTQTQIHISTPPPNSRSTTDLDSTALYLDKSMFPPSLWEAYFEDHSGGGAVLKRRKKNELSDGRKRTKMLGLDDDGQEMDDDPSSDLEASTHSSSVDDEFDFEDESDHQDYDANYFDDGERDDDDDGAGAEEDVGGTYDD